MPLVDDDESSRRAATAQAGLHGRRAPLATRSMSGLARTRVTPNALTTAGVTLCARRVGARLLRVPQRDPLLLARRRSSSSSARSSTSSTARSLARAARGRRSARSSTRRPTASARAFMLGAIALVFTRDGNEVALAFAFAAVAGSFLVSYTRARAEALGLKGDVGIGSRAERVVVITAGLVLAPWGAAAVGDLPAGRDGLAHGGAARSCSCASNCASSGRYCSVLFSIIGTDRIGRSSSAAWRGSRCPAPDPMPWSATIGRGLDGSLIGGTRLASRSSSSTAGGLDLRLPRRGPAAVPATAGSSRARGMTARRARAALAHVSQACYRRDA